MKKVLFVCLGNICRSPMAEAIFNQMVEELNLEYKLVSESKATSAEHLDQHIDWRGAEVLRNHGILCTHLASLVSDADLTRFDLILAMDNFNLLSLKDKMTELGLDSISNKVELFRNYDPEGNGNVPDPYYDGVEAFENVYVILERTVKNLITKLS
jgi:protein-tyrosine phosphatase